MGHVIHLGEGESCIHGFGSDAWGKETLINAQSACYNTISHFFFNTIQELQSETVWLNHSQVFIHRALVNLADLDHWWCKVYVVRQIHLMVHSNWTEALTFRIFLAQRSMTNTKSCVQLNGQGMNLLDILGRSGQKRNTISVMYSLYLF